MKSHSHLPLVDEHLVFAGKGPKWGDVHTHDYSFVFSSIVKAIDHSMYASGFSYTPVASFSVVAWCFLGTDVSLSSYTVDYSFK